MFFFNNIVLLSYVRNVCVICNIIVLLNYVFNVCVIIDCKLFKDSCFDMFICF